MADSSLLNELEFREKELIPGVDKRWLWPKQDNGAWQGPFTDYSNSHQHKYYKNLKGNRCIITAGANMGVYVRHYAQKFDEVYAFEPHWLNFYCMSYNCPYSNVHKFNTALGAQPGFCWVQDKNKNNMGAYKTEDGGKDKNSIPVLTIDSLPWAHVDMIQLDVEGHEFSIVRGAEQTIKKFFPIVIAENHSKQLEDFLRGFGYQFQERSISDYIYYKP